MAKESERADFKNIVSGLWLQEHQPHLHEVVKVPVSQPAFEGNFTLRMRNGKRRMVLRRPGLKITITS